MASSCSKRFLLLSGQKRLLHHYFSKTWQCDASPSISFSNSKLCLHSSTQNIPLCLACSAEPLQQNRNFHMVSKSVNCPVLKNGGKCSIPTCNASTSALYVRHGDDNTAVVEVDLDLENRLGNIHDLEKNLHDRGIPKLLNVYTLANDYKALKEVRDKISHLEAEKDMVARTVKDIVKSKGIEGETSEMQDLRNRGKVIREELKKIKEIQGEVEAKVILEALKLPTELHPSTPLIDTVIEEFGDKPEFNYRVKSHIELGRRTKALKLSTVSDGAFYLRNELAILELDLLDIVSEILRQHGLTQFSNPDLIKTIVMESCGQDFNNPEKVYTLQAKLADLRAQEERGTVEDKLDTTLHLGGGASPYSFVAFLARMNVNVESLPLKCYSIGKSYNPDTEMKNVTKGLYSVPQATRIEMFAAAETAKEANEIYEEYTALLWGMYKDLNLPISMVQIGSPNLGLQEGSRVEIRAWVPSLRDYKKIANVAMWNDHVSRRLMIKSNNTHTHTSSYLQTVHATALSIPELVAAIMENHQTQEGRFQVSHELHKSRRKCVYFFYMTPG